MDLNMKMADALIYGLIASISLNVIQGIVSIMQNMKHVDAHCSHCCDVEMEGVEDQGNTTNITVNEKNDG